MEPNETSLRRLQLIDRLIHLPDDKLVDLEQFFASFQTSVSEQESSVSKKVVDWHHAPMHRISEAGTYIVTAATLDKLHIFKGAERLDYLHRELLTQVRNAGWILEAWAVFSNHYHFVAHAQKGSEPLSNVLGELHRRTSRHVNQLDRAIGRQTWFQFWETRLTFEESYLARLQYVQQNAVKHKLVKIANQYPWCSAAWFEKNATSAQVQKLARIKIDRVHIEDDYEPV